MEPGCEAAAQPGHSVPLAACRWHVSFCQLHAVEQSRAFPQILTISLFNLTAYPSSHLVHALPLQLPVVTYLGNVAHHSEVLCFCLEFPC